MYTLDYKRLDRLADYSAAYCRASPFPHLVIDNFLPDHVLQAVFASFPAVDSGYWFHKDVATSKKLDSRRLDKEILLPGPIRQLVWELNGYRFLSVLQALTGICGLSPDPYLEGAGPHMIERGGYLKVHADFNQHPHTRLHRRLNLLIYLNPDWDDAWGGELELWARDMSACVKRIKPILNRAVIFNTDSDSWHGHPHPLQTPPGVERRSLAMYYYSTPEVALKPHNTIYRDVAESPSAS